MIAGSAAAHVPTVPTDGLLVGTGILEHNQCCSDSSDCSDTFVGRSVKKRISMRDIADRLKADAAKTILSDSLSRHEYQGSEECDLRPDLTTAVGTCRNSRNSEKIQCSADSALSEHAPLLSEHVGTPDPVFPDYSPDCPAEWISGVARLRMALAPAGYPERAWLDLQRDADAIMFSHGPAFSAGGWTTLDLFGCHPDAPYGALWCAGLAFCLDGHRIVEITHAAAKLRTRTGSILTVVRRSQPIAVPVWSIIQTGEKS